MVGHDPEGRLHLVEHLSVLTGHGDHGREVLVATQRQDKRGDLDGFRARPVDRHHAKHAAPQGHPGMSTLTNRPPTDGRIDRNAGIAPGAVVRPWGGCARGRRSCGRHRPARRRHAATPRRARRGPRNRTRWRPMTSSIRASSALPSSPVVAGSTCATRVSCSRPADSSQSPPSSRTSPWPESSSQVVSSRRPRWDASCLAYRAPRSVTTTAELVRGAPGCLGLIRGVVHVVHVGQCPLHAAGAGSRPWSDASMTPS